MKYYQILTSGQTGNVDDSGSSSVDGDIKINHNHKDQMRKSSVPMNYLIML